MKKSVLIGAGQIGRGFLGQTLDASGYELVFVDASQQLVDTMNREGEYKVIIMGADEQEQVVRRFQALTPSPDVAKKEMLEADLVLTAVGPGMLPRVAGMIAQGIAARHAAKVHRPLDVIACENMDNGTSELYGFVLPGLNGDVKDYADEYVGFPNAEVSRLVMPMQGGKPLTVRVEQYMEWIVDRNKVKGDLTGIIGLELKDDATPYIKRKMYTLTGHAMLGYYGYMAGYQYTYQAAYDETIFRKIFRALTECGKGWSLEYGLPLDNFMEYITIMLRRFSDTRMKDECIRVCREPIRKLANDERFIAPAWTAVKHEIAPYSIVDGIRCAMRYDYSGDDQAVRLQSLLKEKGRGHVLREVCGLAENDELYRLICDE